ncbi:DUF2335 domain-containing protein [Yersinia enterocolitica]|uniref:DUF2335 domain-containing protein n=1 Tax=Yersinia TaxID=629 RepID=UPI00119EFADF|nr:MULTISPECIES: DUF2335 domain-containing protein [Yersinia]EKN6031118.1 DUF2335 domain-containing protein [Yersinia enterocolitica]HDL8054718.1 DUF2335 domain-containing protein [Yersinia enterocolitica]HEN3579465.1 DUF2335 domain-containing protein [Yersinia enterocolitica]HEN3611921.1 DUF2335 domain-containing protein [Yersinia enterocolitica]HEN3641362.1 DUF2335 domain-containing protein [Yersinia enterocolitica]
MEKKSKAAPENPKKELDCQQSTDSKELELVDKIESELIEQPEVLERLLEKPSIKRQISMFQGPLPPPQMLSQYEKILPGAAERIFSLTEREQAARHGIQDKAINGAIGKDRRGQWMAYSITLFILVIAVVFAWRGDKWFAGTLITLDLIGLASVFAIGRLSQSDD